MTLPPLPFDDFPSFTAAVHGPEVTLTPCQHELINRLRSRAWPRELAVPDYSQRGVLLDFAVFQLAMQADHGPQRFAPLRMAWVEDRYALVSTVAAQAERLAARLAQALTDEPADSVC